MRKTAKKISTENSQIIITITLASLSVVGILTKVMHVITVLSQQKKKSIVVDENKVKFHLINNSTPLAASRKRLVGKKNSRNIYKKIKSRKFYSLLIPRQSRVSVKFTDYDSSDYDSSDSSIKF